MAGDPEGLVAVECFGGGDDDVGGDVCLSLGFDVVGDRVSHRRQGLCRRTRGGGVGCMGRVGVVRYSVVVVVVEVVDVVVGGSDVVVVVVVEVVVS